MMREQDALNRLSKTVANIDEDIRWDVAMAFRDLLDDAEEEVMEQVMFEDILTRFGDEPFLCQQEDPREA